MEDLLGNPVTLTGAASQRAIDAFVGGFIACESRAADILDAAADASPLVQAYCATLHLFGESRDAAANARPFLERATAQSLRATPREQRYIAAIRAWSQGETRRAIALHEEQAREFPRDLVSLKLGQYHCFNLGDFPAMLRLALLGQQAAPEVPYTHGMTAFGFEQCQMMREAEASARTAIKMERKEPWAQHALAHVMLTEGRLAEGLAFMQGMIDTWVGLNSFMVTHNWWHVALFLIDLGRDAEVLAVYDDHAWGVDKRYSQDQIGAVSLLARCELAGIDVGARWNDLADHLASRIHDHVLPFLDLQYLYGLARAGRPEADAMLRSIEEFVPDAPMSTRAVWKDICVPAAHGLLAHARGDFAAAVEHLDVAMPRLIEIGGSHAQRDLFEQVLLDVLIRGADPALQRRAQDLVRSQASSQPESLRLRRKAALLEAQLA